MQGDSRVPCPHCKGFVEHIPLEEEDLGVIEHRCISCARDLPNDFICCNLCVADRLIRRKKYV